MQAASSAASNGRPVVVATTGPSSALARITARGQSIHRASAAASGGPSPTPAPAPATRASRRTKAGPAAGAAGDALVMQSGSSKRTGRPAAPGVVSRVGADSVAVVLRLVRAVDRHAQVIGLV